MAEKSPPLRVKDANTDNSPKDMGAQMWAREEEEPPSVTGHCVSCDYKFTYPEGLQWKYVLKIVDSHYWMCPNNIQLVLDRLRRQYHKRGKSVEQSPGVLESCPSQAPMEIYTPSTESSYTIHSATESIKTPPLNYASPNANVPQKTGQLAVNIQMNPTPPAHRQQDFVIHKVRQPTTRKKNMMDESARRRLLELDEWALKVRPTSVVCKACRRVISLDKRSRYYPGLWIKHREKCPKVLKFSRGRTQGALMTAERGENAMFQDRLGDNITTSPIDKEAGKVRSDRQIIEDTDSEMESNYNEVTYATSYSSCSIPSSPVPLSGEEGRKKRMRTYSATLRSTRPRYDAGSDSGLRVEMDSRGKAERGSHTQRLIHRGAYFRVKTGESLYRTTNTGQNLTEAKFDAQAQDTTANQKSHTQMGDQALRTFSTDNASNDESSDSENGHYHLNRTYLTPPWSGHIRAAASDHYHDLSPTMSRS